MFWRGDHSDRCATRYFLFCFWIGRLFRFLITVLLRSKWKHGSHECFIVFVFVDVLYSEHKYQNTSGGYKSHLCFLIFANQKTNRGMSLICFPNWITPHEEAKDGIYRRGCFSGCFFFLFWCCEWKMKIDITDHIPITFFCFIIMKKERETWLHHSYFPLSNRRTKNERTVYTTHGVFPFFLFSSCKRKKRKHV